MTTDEINEFLEEFHKLSEDGTMPDPVEDPEGYLEIVNQMKSVMFSMPKYKNGNRNVIEEYPSLLGAFGKLFLRLEDAYLRLSEMGSEAKLEPEEIIREHAFEIAVAMFQYVSKAVVHADAEGKVVGFTGAGIPIVGTSTGKSKGKLN